MAMGFNQKAIEMKKLMRIIAIFFIVISCDSHSQTKSIDKSNKTSKMNSQPIPLKKFEIDDFVKNKEADNSYTGYTTDEGIEIVQEALTNNQVDGDKFIKEDVIEYIQTENYPDGFSDIYVFNKVGKLLIFNRYFQEVHSGIWKTYSEDGKILSEENKDINYPFSIQQVIDFSKKHKGNLSENGSLKRRFDEKLKKHIYEIQWIVDEPNKSYTKAFILDGSDGKIIKEFEKPVPWIGR